jgi:hypothetical protein
MDPSHANVKPTEYWIGLFARHGMYRDLDFDASFVTPQAVCFHHAESALQVIRTYERHLFRITQELRAVREANVQSTADRARLTAELADLTAQPAAAERHRSFSYRALRALWRLLPQRLRHAVRGAKSVGSG